jgi:hypothetical protein
MNSRAYRFILPVNARADIPDDFDASLGALTFERGVFLPQADTDWYTETPEYPARLLLLNGRRLYVIPHPSSDEDNMELNLADVAQFEMGSSLLSGWIQLSTHLATLKLPYNTRASDRLEEFVALVRRRWLGAPTVGMAWETGKFVPELDIKFRNLLLGALDPDEFSLAQCFSPPLKYQSGFSLLRKNKWRPGHLVVLTSGNRLIWLKDEYRGDRERFAGITISAPISLLRGCSVETTPNYSTLVVDFKVGNPWRITIYEVDADCDRFTEAVNRIVVRTWPRHQTTAN